MSRSGYSDDNDCDIPQELYQQAVNRAISGKRGQTFLHALAEEMDAMPAKRLIKNELLTDAGEVCAMGVICKARGLDVTEVDECDRDAVGKLLDIAPALAAEIAYQNDQDFERREIREQTPEERWVRMRKWVAGQLK